MSGSSAVFHNLTCIMSLIVQIRVQYLTNHIIKLNTMEMRSLRSWTEIGWTWQSHCRLPLKIKKMHRVCNFGPQIRLPDGHFGQFRAIGPMVLLRPAHRIGHTAGVSYTHRICHMADISYPQNRSHDGHIMYPHHRSHGGHVMYPQHRLHGGHIIYPQNRSHSRHVIEPQFRSHGGHVTEPQYRSLAGMS